MKLRVDIDNTDAIECPNCSESDERVYLINRECPKPKCGYIDPEECTTSFGGFNFVEESPEVKDKISSVLENDVCEGNNTGKGEDLINGYSEIKYFEKESTIGNNKSSVVVTVNSGYDIVKIRIHFKYTIIDGRPFMGEQEGKILLYHKGKGLIKIEKELDGEWINRPLSESIVKDFLNREYYNSNIENLLVDHIINNGSRNEYIVTN